MGRHRCLMERNALIERLVVAENMKQGQAAKLVSHEYPSHPITQAGISHMIRRVKHSVKHFVIQSPFQNTKDLT
jgi:hypothetical protein